MIAQLLFGSDQTPQWKWCYGMMARRSSHLPLRAVLEGCKGTTGGFGPNPLQKDNIIQVHQTDNLKIFLKGEPQILGVTQILIGLMKVCLFVIGLCFYSSDFPYWCYPLTMVSGYPVWGSLFVSMLEYLSFLRGRIHKHSFQPSLLQTNDVTWDFTSSSKFFLSGAVSIAAGRKMTLNLIKGSLGVNLLSAVAGVIGIIVLIIELTVLFAPEKKCLILRTFEIVILVLSLLEVSIAISLSVFGCKVTCFVTQVVIIQSTNDKVSSAIAPHEHIYEELEFE
ncbi:membrane-spanning 4-domains subfamily A member 4A-like isoform X1 [Panthera onca]|uniref:membrane-spanning 4-domains subfamily A member 4A-like isoform X1 n=1 Tax=Panthera onca TaxID=9690 RepID=UPI002954EDF2|nr:membrane-spanning 4-domains subfamily A member 4A-like isoform X1 [Panthera onca]